MSIGRLAIIIGIPVLAITLFSVYAIDFETLEIKAFQGDVKRVQSNTAIEDEITATIIKAEEEPQGRVITIEIHDGVGTEEQLGN